MNMDHAFMALQCAVFVLTVLIFSVPLGEYMARVYRQDAGLAETLLGPLERLLLAAAGVKRAQQMTWKGYAAALLLFNFVGFVTLLLLQLFQHRLPLNPAALGPVGGYVAFNTAVSFVTNTNWQAYSGETTMSHLTQMLGLTVQNFVSAATGMAVLVALIRGFTQKNSATIGNFWVDLVRTTVFILLPLSFLMALVLVADGVIQTFRGSVIVTTLESGAEQILALGPVASQVAIKQLGTNGGGYFSVNSAHPFENPTPFTNLAELTAILLIPAALCFTFGSMIGDRRQGRALSFTLWVVFLPFLFFALGVEQAGNPALLGADQAITPLQSGGNMEGKETRFGITSSVLWAVATTAASNGSVNAMHDSLTALGGLFPLVLMQLGEVIFGGVGSGLYGLLAYAIIAVFISGLMVGRTPEYLGKKIEALEIKMASLTLLLPATAVLVGTAVAVSNSAGKAAIANPGPHGFTEVLYAFSSAANNNGSAFGGLAAAEPFYAILLAVAMLVGRYGVIIPILAIAGALAAKKSIPEGPGTLPTHGPLFIGLLAGTILLLGALTYVPALALGPVAEALTGATP